MSILDKFTVVDLIKTRSDSVATITGNALKFNNQTAGEMSYAPYIQVLINLKEKQFAIRACKEGEANAVPFSKPEGEQKNQIRINTAAVVNMIRKMANWSVEDNWNIPGVYIADETALVYDVNAAYRPVARGKNAAKHQPEEEAEVPAETSVAYPSVEIDG